MAINKKLILIISILVNFSFCFAENNFMFLDLIPIFPERDNLKELSKEYNLTLEKYENNEFKFSCNSLKNKHYEITSLNFNYSENNTTIFVTCTKAAAFSLLKKIFKEEYNLINIEYDYSVEFNEENLAFAFYNSNSNIITILNIPNFDYELTDIIDISISYFKDNKNNGK